ncbi:MAG: S-methyl-5-thioribose-1-phosphate isomerase, partial [Proteobacteria bacterium]|nr:S-methyl-5-thioribose-1-phosphate isomerase [Pseudomonadota bacterium]
RELTEYHEVALAPAEAGVWNPVFDITPAGLVTALVTEKGVVHAPCQEKILALLQD